MNMHYDPAFFKKSITRIFSEKRRVLDIGGGLRVDRSRNNRRGPSRKWLLPLLEKAEYRVIDRVPDYHPDLVGDIHALPLADASVDAVICLSVLEHVEDPLRAMREIHRVLVPGGYAFLYVPFLYYYHAEHGYYKDYWRFTKDAVDYMCRDFSSIERMPVRGAIEAWIKIIPLGRSALICKLAHGLDLLTDKIRSNQVGGYNVFLQK